MHQAISSQMLSTTTKYTWYQTIKEVISKSPIGSYGQQSTNFVAGAISGVLESLMTHPIDVLKIHYQMRTPFRPKFNKYGFKIFYRGYSKTFTKSSIGSFSSVI